MSSELLWSSVRITPSKTDDASRARCAAALFEAGAQGVHEDGNSLVTHFPPGTDVDEVQAILRGADADAEIAVAPVPQIDWSEQWKSRIGAHDLGALSIVPPWLAEGRDPARTIIIEPGMAFGTGEHATTRGVVRLLPTVLRPGDAVADLGSGSAVLSIAAAKLGARQVFAIELDGEAMPDAESNVERNGVADRVHLFEGDAAALLPLVAPVRVVLANIISSVITGMLPVIAESITEDASVILSGILVEEREHMHAVLTEYGWRIIREDVEDIWWSASIVRA